MDQISNEHLAYKVNKEEDSFRKKGFIQQINLKVKNL